MKKDSTLIYIVNGIQTNESTQLEQDSVIEKTLTSLKVEPSERSIKNILDFAASYEVLETEDGGYVELNLN